MSNAEKVLEQLGGVPVNKARAPFLHKRVERLSVKAGIKKPLVYVIQDDAPNACAVGLSDDDTAVAVTTGLLENLDENEIEAVLAHELGHIQKGHSVTKTKVAIGAMAVSLMARTGGDLLIMSDNDFTPGDSDPDDLASLAIKIFGRAMLQAGGDAMASSMLTAASFDSEYEADQCGGVFSKKPWALVSALRRIEALTMEGDRAYKPEVAQLFIVSPAYLHDQTHPPTSQRIERLMEMQGHLPRLANVPTVYCPSCGDKTDADGKYCYWCGGELDASSG